MSTKVKTKSAGDYELAIARSHVYLLCALAFRYPTRETMEVIRESLKTLSAKPGVLGTTVDQAINATRERISGLRLTSIESEYLLVFTHINSSDCYPCETAYVATHLFQQAHRIADLNGFYRAHGVEPSLERSDHIGVEMEFMAFLAQKQAMALAQGRPRRARQALEDQRAFLERHLGPWARTFLRFLSLKADDGIYESLAALADAFLLHDFERIGAQVKEVKGPPVRLSVTSNEEDDSDECPDFTLAEPRPIRPPTHLQPEAHN